MARLEYHPEMIARPRRIIKLSPAKKAKIAEYEEATAHAVQMRKVSKLAKKSGTQNQKSNVIAPAFEQSTLSSMIKSFSHLIDDDETMLDNIIQISTAYLRHEPGSIKNYRTLRILLSQKIDSRHVR